MKRAAIAIPIVVVALVILRRRRRYTLPALTADDLYERCWADGATEYRIGQNSPRISCGAAEVRGRWG